MSRVSPDEVSLKIAALRILWDIARDTHKTWRFYAHRRVPP
jgi:hypothetical protein